MKKGRIEGGGLSGTLTQGADKKINQKTNRLRPLFPDHPRYCFQESDTTI